MGLSLAAVSGDYSLVAVYGLLVVGASLAVEHGLRGTTPSFPSQPEGKIRLPRANPRGSLRSPSDLENPTATRETPRGSHLLAR